MAAVLVLNTPDDGRLHPKHVEWLCRNLHSVASSWCFHLTCTMMHGSTKLKWSLGSCPSFFLQRGSRISSSWPPLIYTFELILSQNNPGPHFSNNYFHMCCSSADGQVLLIPKVASPPLFYSLCFCSCLLRRFSLKPASTSVSAQHMFATHSQVSLINTWTLQ